MTVGMKEIDANDSTSPEGEMSGTRRSIGKQYVELEKWLEKKENKEKLKPPVCNTMLFGGKKTLCERKGQEEMQVMLVGGPNTRSDYHIELGSEFFYQVEGTLRLWVQEYGNTIREVTINAGQVFMLPACVPHSPNREKGGIGIVLERQRRVGERDGIKWFTRSGDTLHEEYFTCTDLGTDLKPIIERFHASEEYKTGERSAASPPIPEPEVEIDTRVSLGNAFSLDEWIDAGFASLEDSSGKTKSLFAAAANQDFAVDVIFGSCRSEQTTTPTTSPALEWSQSETFVMVVRGSCMLHVNISAADDTKDTNGCTNGQMAMSSGNGTQGIHHEMEMVKKDIFLVPEGAAFAVVPSQESAVLTVKLGNQA